MLKILVVDDEIQNRKVIEEILSRMGHSVILAENGQIALEKARAYSFDLIFSDIRMPVLDGIQFFEAFQKVNQQKVPVVFMTAYGKIEEAVQMMRQGAFQFLIKPLKKKDLVEVVNEVQKIAESKHSISEIDENEVQPVYASRAFGEALQMAEKVANTLTSILITGESGTGKEVIARRVHRLSERAERPFVAFHAASVPETLLESELFGHEKGAFTGAEVARIGQIRSAEGGTFFIDELASMPLFAQVKLLRVIQDKEVTPIGSVHPISCDVRWISATNESLETLVSQGRFREDLLYRLKVVVIEIPPLRERPEDIEPLMESFLHEYAKVHKQSVLKVPDKIVNMLLNYSWPGNVRELRNIIERAVVLAPDNEFTLDLLPPHIAESEQCKQIRVAVGTPLQTVEDRVIEETLRFCDGDKVKAAAILGVAPRTLYRWVERNS